jgi:Ala-tRNA(Pro) deacylase
MFDRLNELLRQKNACFRVIHHSAEGSSAKVAEIRGTLPGQGAKAMLCRVKDLPEVFLLAVLPGDRKVDFKKLGQAVGGKKASLVTTEEATKLTGCVMGAVPPFSFWPNIKLVVDPKLLDDHEEIAFNAGRLDTSMVLNSQDYRRIAAPLMADITAA